MFLPGKRRIAVISFLFFFFPVSLQMRQVYLHVIGQANFLCRFALDHLLKVVLYSDSVVLFQKVSALPTDTFSSQLGSLIMLPSKDTSF